MESLGSLLRAERQRRGVSLQEVEEATNIRHQYLEALEEENFQSIPGKVYALGFLRNYARYLGLPPEPLVEELKQRWDGEPPPIQELSESEYSERPKNHSMRLLGYAVTLAAIGTLIYFGVNLSQQQRAPVQPLTPAQQTPQTPQTPQQTGPTETPSPETVQPPVQPPAQTTGVTVVLRVKDRRCWVRAFEDGNKKLEQILNPGETITLQANEKVSLRVGDGGAAELEVNGKLLGPMGEAGVPVEAEYTKQS